MTSQMADLTLTITVVEILSLKVAFRKYFPWIYLKFEKSYFQYLFLDASI